MLQDFTGLFENKFALVLFGFFALSIAWSVVRNFFDKVVKRRKSGRFDLEF